MADAPAAWTPPDGMVEKAARKVRGKIVVGDSASRTIAVAAISATPMGRMAKLLRAQVDLIDQQIEPACCGDIIVWMNDLVGLINNARALLRDLEGK